MPRTAQGIVGVNYSEIYVQTVRIPRSRRRMIYLRRRRHLMKATTRICRVRCVEIAAGDRRPAADFEKHL